MKKKLLFFIVLLTLTLSGCKNYRVGVENNEDIPKKELNTSAEAENDTSIDDERYIFSYGADEINTVDETFVNTEDETIVSAEDETLAKEYDYYVAEGIDLDADYDGDGLTNGEEIEIGCNYMSIDTDKDGLSDYDEVMEYKTSPVLADTDGDGLNDRVEIIAGLNPLSATTDGIADIDRLFEAVVNEGNVNLTMNGNANVYSTTVEETNLDRLYMPCMVSDIYELTCGGTFDSAKLEIALSDEQLEDIDEGNLAIAWITPEGKIEILDSKFDYNSNTVSANLSHFSLYAVVDISRVVEDKPDIYILIDNSGSMYPVEMCAESRENDVDFKRVDMAKSLIAELGNSCNIGLAKFTATYTNLSGGFGKSYEELLSLAEDIKTKKETFNGTYIGKSLMKTIDKFDDGYNTKYIVMLTDGYTTEKGNNTVPVENIIKAANEKNVRIIVIGLGNDIDVSYMQQIANGTNGLYVYANNANALDSVVSTILEQLDNGFVDSDGDEQVDSIVIADCGFKMKRDNFPFANPIIIDELGNEITGQCDGIARFVQEYYLGIAPCRADAIEAHMGLPVGYGHEDGLSWRDEIGGMAFEFDESFPFYGEPYLNNKVSLYTMDIYGEYLRLMNLPYDERYHRDSNNDNKIIYSDEIHDFVNENSDFFYIYVEECKKPISAPDNIEVHALERINFKLNTNIDKSHPYYQFYMMLCALNNYQAYQPNGSILWDEKIDSYYINDDNGEGFNKLVEDLRMGIPVKINSYSHAVTAIRILRDSKDSNLYRLFVYDSNQPKRERELEIRRRNLFNTGLDSYVYYEVTDTMGIFGESGNNVSLKCGVSDRVRELFEK